MQRHSQSTAFSGKRVSLSCPFAIQTLRFLRQHLRTKACPHRQTMSDEQNCTNNPIFFFFFVCECAACCLNSNLNAGFLWLSSPYLLQTPRRTWKAFTAGISFLAFFFFFFFFFVPIQILRIRHMYSTISWRVVPPMNPGCDLYSLPPHPCVPVMGCLDCATGRDPDVSGWRCTHRRSLTSFSLSRSPTAGRQEHHNYRRRRL